MITTKAEPKEVTIEKVTELADEQIKDNDLVSIFGATIKAVGDVMKSKKGQEYQFLVLTDDSGDIDYGHLADWKAKEFTDQNRCTDADVGKVCNLVKATVSTREGKKKLGVGKLEVAATKDGVATPPPQAAPKTDSKAAPKTEKEPANLYLIQKAVLESRHLLALNGIDVVFNVNAVAASVFIAADKRGLSTDEALARYYNYPKDELPIGCVPEKLKDLAGRLVEKDLTPEWLLEKLGKAGLLLDTIAEIKVRQFPSALYLIQNKDNIEETVKEVVEEEQLLPLYGQKT